MAALPYMPLFVADYLADTPHLTTTQHGAYLLLLMNYWQRGGPLPDDDARLARIARVGHREWARMKGPISEFFTLTHGAWVHKRADTELARVAAKSLKCREAGRTSAERRFNKRSTNAEPTEAHTDTSSEANASAVDAETVMWREGRRYLQDSGVSASQTGAMLGKWKKEYGAEAVIVALGKAQREGAIDPVSFITACLGGKRGRDGYDPERITI